jgi:segregation and condensation protein A
MLWSFPERKMADKKQVDDTTPLVGELDIPSNFESILPDYPVKVADFNGPLDLLIYLIKKNQVDIYDIPIVLITNQYLEYLELMQELNLDVAGEFLVMSATLIHIKSRTLVPRLETESADDLDEEDPRDALVERLLEHQRFKMAAELLHERETVRSAQWTRPEGLVEEISGEPFERELEVDLFSLLQAFQSVLKRSREYPAIRLPSKVVPIETRIQELVDKLASGGACGFNELFPDASSRQELITTFLAVLEMIRLKLIRVFQQGARGPIRVYARTRSDDDSRRSGTSIRDESAMRKTTEKDGAGL